MDKTIKHLIRYSKKYNYNIFLTNDLITKHLSYCKEQKNHAKAWLVNLYLIVMLFAQKAQYILFNTLIDIGDVCLHKFITQNVFV